MLAAWLLSSLSLLSVIGRQRRQTETHKSTSESFHTGQTDNSLETPEQIDSIITLRSILLFGLDTVIMETGPVTEYFLSLRRCYAVWPLAQTITLSSVPVLRTVNCVLNRTMSQFEAWRIYTACTPTDPDQTLKSKTRPSSRNSSF